MKEFSNADLAAPIDLTTISLAHTHPAPLPMHAASQAGLDAYDVSDALETALTGTVVTGALLFAAFSVHFLLAQLGAAGLVGFAAGALYLAAGVVGCLTVTELGRGIARLARR